MSRTKDSVSSRTCSWSAPVAVTIDSIVSSRVPPSSRLATTWRPVWLSRWYAPVVGFNGTSSPSDRPSGRRRACGTLVMKKPRATELPRSPPTRPGACSEGSDQIRGPTDTPPTCSTGNPRPGRPKAIGSKEPGQIRGEISTTRGHRHRAHRWWLAAVSPAPSLPPNGERYGRFEKARSTRPRIDSRYRPKQTPGVEGCVRARSPSVPSRTSNRAYGHVATMDLCGQPSPGRCDHPQSPCPTRYRGSPSVPFHPTARLQDRALPG